MERGARPDGKRQKYMRALAFVASGFKTLAGMIGTAAALIAILQAFELWP